MFFIYFYSSAFKITEFRSRNKMKKMKFSWLFCLQVKSFHLALEGTLHSFIFLKASVQQVSHSNGNTAFTNICELLRNNQKCPIILGRFFLPNAPADCDTESSSASNVKWKDSANSDCLCNYTKNVLH